MQSEAALGNTSGLMGAHFAKPVSRPRPGRRRQAGFLSIALGVGLLAFAFLDEDGTPVRSTSPTVPPSSEPTVLGVTVEPGPSPSAADPATPVSLSVPDDGAPATSAPRSTTTGAPATTTTAGPVLIPPTVVTNTETTRSTTTTSSTPESTTTSTGEAETTTTEAGAG